MSEPVKRYGLQTVEDYALAKKGKRRTKRRAKTTAAVSVDYNIDSDDDAPIVLVKKVAKAPKAANLAAHTGKVIPECVLCHTC
ncbi:hypothetical protein KIPB_008587 [Kipferlia bialata]|uniref:Uncharacterized protein n=1 Tax=Kipferlia bialata TaxID=797122 RepID=A0A391NVK0_9EUKA|nr:hypothetical protein KIPB_008587 [Kipferlia bialata]|eukprot:g8587.t1